MPSFISNLITGGAALLGQALGGVTATAVNWVLMILGNTVAWFANLLFTFGAMLVKVALDLNFAVGSQSNRLAILGWGIVRDIANLGFVLLIVIIAIATILRIEQYGVSKLLPKMIAAAIIVNFSFALAGVFIDFSNVLTNFFFNKINPQNNSLIASSIAGAFNPQQLLASSTPSDAAGTTQDKTPLEGISVAVLNLMFIIAFTFAGALTLITLAFMLLIRYLYLSFLLVVAPIIWLFWVFPGLGGQFSKWWHSFFKWIFFAPASAFFLYLALMTASDMSTIVKRSAGDATFGSSGLTGVLATGAQMIVLVGIMLGGIIIANQMGITGASGALAIANKTKSAALSWTGRKSLQYGSSFLRKKGEEDDAKSRAERIQTWAQQRKSGITRFAAGWVARGATKLVTAGGEDQVKYHESRVARMTNADAKAALLTAFGPLRIALVKKLTQAKQLGDVDMTKLSTPANKVLFNGFGQGKAFSEMENAGLMSVDMNKALASGNMEAYEEAMNKFVAKLTKKDVDTAALKDLFGKKLKFGLDESSMETQAKFFARAVLTQSPALVANILPKFDARSLEKFTDTYRNELKNEKSEISRMTDSPEKEKRQKNYDKAEKSFDQVIVNYSLGFTPVETGAPAGSTAPPESTPTKPNP